MGFVRDTFFGGAERRAGERAQEAGERSAELQVEAGREGAQLQRQSFEEIRDLSTPFIQPGLSAFNQQARFAGAQGPEQQRLAFAEFEESPGVQFLREQGLRQLESGQAQRGGLGGGERLRELTRFGQGLALQDFSNQFNRLGAVSGVGLGALGGLSGVSTASSAGQAQSLQGGALGAAQGLQAGAAGFGAGIVGQAGVRRGLATDVAQVAGFASDIRLKKNIVKIGELESGLSWYQWDWTEEAKKLVGDQATDGVIAQEAKELFPDAVFERNGYLAVNYGSIH